MQGSGSHRREEDRTPAQLLPDLQCEGAGGGPALTFSPAAAMKGLGGAFHLPHITSLCSLLCVEQADSANTLEPPNTKLRPEALPEIIHSAKLPWN